MATALYTGASSVTDSPMVLHTVSYDVSRDGTTIYFTFYLESWLQYSTSWMGKGKYVSFEAHCTFNGVNYSSGEAIFKLSDYYWCASSAVDDYAGKTPRQVGHLTAAISLSIPNVGDISALTITTQTIRSDGTSMPGVHSRTNSIGIPAAIAPAVPSLTMTPPAGNPYIKSRDPVVFTAANNGTGSGTFVKFRYNISLNDGAWTLYTGMETTNTVWTDTPVVSTGTSMRWRVGIVSSTGQITWSAPTGYLYCAAAPAQMVAPTPDRAIIVNPTDTVRFNFTPLNPAPQSGVKRYVVGLTVGETPLVDYTTNPYYDLIPSVYGGARGNSVTCDVLTQSIVDLYGAESPACAISIANLPANVGGFVAASYSPTLVGSINLAWNAASPGSGTLSGYNIEYAWKAPGGAWSAWLSLATLGAVTTLQEALSEHSAYANFVPNTQLKYRIKAKNQYDLLSAEWTETAVLTILGGLLNKKISGAYQQGLAYKKKSGAWYLAIEIYKKKSGTWRMGVG